jgi:hypothetical protein
MSVGVMASTDRGQFHFRRAAEVELATVGCRKLNS